VRRPAGRLEGFEAMKNRLEGVQHLRVLGSAVAGPDRGGASLGDVDKSRRGDDGGGRRSCGVLGLVLYERGAKRESRLSTSPSPAGGGLYKDSCPTLVVLLENVASTCSRRSVVRGHGFKKIP
jgi:hypothetical protein